jgi:hypothetical protein
VTRRKKTAIALAAMREVGFTLTDKANRLEHAGLGDLATDLRELAEWLFDEADAAAGVTDGRH